MRHRRAGIGAITVLVVVVVLSGCSSSKKSVVTPPLPSAAGSAASQQRSAASSALNSAGYSPSRTSAAHPTIKVVPSTHLAATAQVRITGSGFTADEALTVIECADKGSKTGPGDCDLTGMRTATSDASGAVTAALEVHKGPFGGNNIVCGATQRCLVSVTQASPTPTEEADAPISFS